MPVTYDFSDVRDHELLHSDRLEWGKTEALFNGGWSLGIFDIIGMGSITEENAGEVWARLAISQGLVGSFLNRNGIPVLYTKEDITRRIGLRSNYSNRTRTEFFKTVKGAMDQVVNELNTDLRQRVMMKL
jgi:hypothetical protein